MIVIATSARMAFDRRLKFVGEEQLVFSPTRIAGADIDRRSFFGYAPHNRGGKEGDYWRNFAFKQFHNLPSIRPFGC